MAYKLGEWVRIDKLDESTWPPHAEHCELEGGREFAWDYYERRWYSPGMEIGLSDTHGLHWRTWRGEKSFEFLL